MVYPGGHFFSSLTDEELRRGRFSPTLGVTTELDGPFLDESYLSERRFLSAKFIGKAVNRRF